MRHFQKKQKISIPEEERKLVETELAGIPAAVEKLQSLGGQQTAIDTLLTRQAALEHKLAGTVLKYNSVRVSYKGEWYHSKLEVAFAKRLDEAGMVRGVDYTWQNTFVLVESFMLKYERVNELKIIPDYLLYDYVLVDVKGHHTDQWLDKWKMLKSIFRDRYVYFLVHNKSEFDAVISFARQQRKA